MKKLELVRFDHNAPSFEKMTEMRASLEEMLEMKADFSNVQWRENLNAIISYRNEKGGFPFLDSYEIDGDCRVEYCHEPTYICTAILIKAYLADKGFFADIEETVLKPALHMCCARGLKGHGFDEFSGIYTALKIFQKCSIIDFLKKYPEICPEFTEMFNEITFFLLMLESQERYYGPFGECIEDKVTELNDYYLDYFDWPEEDSQNGKEN